MDKSLVLTATKTRIVNEAPPVCFVIVGSNISELETFEPIVKLVSLSPFLCCVVIQQELSMA